MIGMTRSHETHGPGPVTAGSSKVVRAIFICVLLAVAIAFPAPPRPVLAQQTVEEIIAEYQRLKQDQKRANVIVDNQEKYSESEVEKAIQDREYFGRRLQVLKSQITDRGGKIPKKENPPGEANPDPPKGTEPDAEKKPEGDAELKLTGRQISDIGKEERRILRDQNKLKGLDPNSKRAIQLKENIEKWKNRIRKIRAKAARVLRDVPPEGKVEGKHGDEPIKKKMPEVRRPWKLGHWPWDFHSHDKFEALKEKYYRLQAEMGAVLLIKQTEWTRDQAIKYNGQLSILCALIINTEERIAFGLGDAKKFESAIRGHKRKWNEYLAKQKITDDAEAKMMKIYEEYLDLLKKAGVKPGVISAKNPYRNAIADKINKFDAAKENFVKVQKESEQAKYAPGPVSDATKQRIKDGVAFTHRKPPKLEIHRGCAGNEPSLVYKMFLNEEEMDTFEVQGTLRRLRK